MSLRGASVAALLAIGLSGAAAYAQGPPSALGQIDALAAAVETRANTLSEATDLTMDAMQRYAWELDAHVSMLVDASAPFPPLAALMPEMRETIGELVDEAGIGAASDVEDAADDLLDQIGTFRVYVRNLAASP